MTINKINDHYPGRPTMRPANPDPVRLPKRNPTQTVSVEAGPPHGQCGTSS
jgi:hypothetical protein